MKRIDSILTDGNYKNYLIQYSGDITSDFSLLKDYYLTIINDKYAIATVPFNVNFYQECKTIESIVYLDPYTLYSLLDINPIDAANITSLNINLPLSLKGNGVTIALIDTGIDYLNPCFMTKDGNTRIIGIWDQTIPYTKKSEFPIPFGSFYSKDDINKAITYKKNGGDPYSIVPSKDELSHGTSMAALIGGRFDDNSIKSVCPDCEFLIIKLMEDVSSKINFNTKPPVYNVGSIVAAMNFLSRYIEPNKIPMVIYFPLGSNLGNHKGVGILEELIDEISLNRGVVVVTGTGNEGNSEGHTSGAISQTNDYNDIQLYVDTYQKYLKLFIWVYNPNVMSLSIISPSGETTGIIPASINSTKSHTFTFERSEIFVKYSMPEEFSGDELIMINLYNLQPGTWKLRLTANYVLGGEYDAWIPQKALISGNTRFISSNPYGTLTCPCPSRYAMSVANYNQINNTIINSSGMAFLNDVIDRIDVAAGGFNVKSIDNLGNETIVSGTSISAAIVAGCCALLLEWGIVDGNDPSMYSQKIKTYLIRGTTKRPGDMYPNAEWGYGILNMFGVFQNI